jgi:predicted CoA-binding protein
VTELNKDARRGFWSRPGTFGIYAAFEKPGQLGWMLLEQCQREGIEAVPVNREIDEALGVAAVRDPAEIEELAGIVCVRLDPHATEAVERAGELDVPVWLSLRTASDDARAAAKDTDADLIADTCPLMYLDVGSYHAFHRFLSKVFGRY